MILPLQRMSRERRPRSGRGARFASAVIAAFALLIVPGAIVRAVEVAGIQVDPKARVGGVDLSLNGAGLRRLFMVDVYVIGLYFSGSTSSAEAAIAAAGPKRIALTFMRDVTARSLQEALYEGIRDSSSESEFKRLKSAADTLSATMLPLQLARKGDTVALDYVPDAGAQVVVNGRAIGQPIPGHDLYRALLKIWLGDPPIDTRLKRALLLGRN